MKKAFQRKQIVKENVNESNKDNILDLAEKHYENLVEALTNNAITIASSNPKPALPPSSSTFLNLSNQKGYPQNRRARNL